MEIGKRAVGESKIPSAFPPCGKKGQGRTFWIVITAIVALVVLVVLIMIFTGKTGMLETGLMGCESKGGTCEFCGTWNTEPGACANVCGEGKTLSTVFDCPEGKVCCLGVKKQEEIK